MRLAVTQRVVVDPTHGERRDCLDQRWALLMEPLGINLLPVPNGLADVRVWIETQAVAGILLSGGNSLAHLPDNADAAPERDATEAALLSWAAEHRTPVLGVCRGMQMICHHLGNRLVSIGGHIARRHFVYPEPGVSHLGPAFASTRMVNSYHNWAVAELNPRSRLEPLARAQDGSIEAVRHRDLPWLGVMWHPERETPTNALDTSTIQDIFCRGAPGV